MLNEYRECMSFNHKRNKYQRENEVQLYILVQDWRFKKQHVKLSITKIYHDNI